MIDNKTISAIEYDLQGTTQTLEAVCLEHGVTEEEVLKHGLEVEMCEECGWWCETSELVSEDGSDTGRCEDCRGND